MLRRFWRFSWPDSGWTRVVCGGFLVAAAAAPGPRTYGGPDVNEITGGEGTSPHVTQSETQTWAEGNTVVTTYNDSGALPIAIRAAPIRRITGRRSPTSTRVLSAPVMAPVSATRSLSMTARMRSGSRSFLLPVAAARGWVFGPRLTARPGRRARARRAVRTIVSSARSTTTRRVPITGGCTFPGTTSRRRRRHPGHLLG